MKEFHDLRANISALNPAGEKWSDINLRRAKNAMEYAYERLVDYDFLVCLECERQQVDLDLCLQAEDAPMATPAG